MKSSSWYWLGIVLSGAFLQLLYLPTRLAGFVTDYTGLAERIETHGAQGIISSFGFPALQPLTSLFYYLFYQYFSVDGSGWYVVATLLHTANSVFLFFLIRSLLSEVKRERGLPTAVFGALLFLFSPYASEVAVWRVGFHYLLVTLLILAILWQTNRWVVSPKPGTAWSIVGLQFAALMTYELAIMAPLLSLLLIGWKVPQSSLRPALKRITAPQFALIALYFLANRVVLGAWIGHYGSAVHLQFPIRDMVANLGRYSVKWIGFSRYWPHAGKEGIAQTLVSAPGLIALSLVLAVAIVGCLKYFRRSGPMTQFTWIFGLAALIALLPVLNLYFNYLLHIENDRYGYLPQLFFYPALIALFSRLPRVLFIGLSGVYLLASVVLLHRTNQYWAQSTGVYRGLLDDFDSYDRDTCYLLNLPDNLQGAPMFRDYSGKDRAFADALRYVKRKPYNGVLEEVVQYNMTAPTDGVSVEPDSSGLKVTFNQWGNWWWRRGIGAYSYRDSSYRFYNEGHHYRLEWRTRPADALILYQDGPWWITYDHPLENTQKEGD